MSDLNLIGWSGQRPCMGHHGARTSVLKPLRFLYHIHYISSDLRHHFLINIYGIFLSLHPAISYQRTISAYNIFLSVSSTSVFILDSIPYLFDPTLTTFPAYSLVEGGTICRVYTCFHPMITSHFFAKRSLCRDFIKKYASMCSVMQYAIGIFLLSARYLAKK